MREIALVYNQAKKMKITSKFQEWIEWNSWNDFFVLH